VRVPDIGDFKDVSVIEVLVKPGDTIKVEQSLITVESDKASMEIPSSCRRRVERAQGQAGRQGQYWGSGGVAGRLCRCRPGAQAAATPAPAAAAAPAAAPAAVPAPQPWLPAARTRHAIGLGCPMHLRRCASSRASWACRWPRSRAAGPKGRITQDDVQNFTKRRDGRSVQTKASAAKAPAAGSGGDGAALA
jgi:pyruvate dehydrogenase E2 component (dihydrolipoamide acetyltransferase)